MTLEGLGINRIDLPTDVVNTPIDVIPEVQNFVDNMPTTDESAGNRDAIRQLHSLALSYDVIVNTADKNLGFVINNIKWYHNETSRQVNNKKTYREIVLISGYIFRHLGRMVILYIHTVSVNFN